MRYDFKRRIIKNKGWRIDETGTPVLESNKYFKGGYRGYGDTLDEARFWVSKKEDLPIEEFKTEAEWEVIEAEEKAKADEAKKKAVEEKAKKEAEEVTPAEVVDVDNTFINDKNPNNDAE